jgi:hypothetical protein
VDALSDTAAATHKEKALRARNRRAAPILLVFESDRTPVAAMPDSLVVFFVSRKLRHLFNPDSAARDFFAAAVARTQQ